MRDRTSRRQPQDIPIDPTKGTTETDIPIQTPGAPRAGQPASSSTDVVSQTQQQASQLMDKAQAQAKSRLTTQKHQATQGLQSLAQTLDQTSQQLQQQGQDSLAQYATKAGDQVEQLTHYLQQRDINELMDEAQDYARGHPISFLAGAFALGFTAARFLKSSSQPIGQSGVGNPSSNGRQ
jgi:exonuclease VII large subunit